MRVWDIHPGYLDRQRLLAEHGNLHNIVAFLARNPDGDGTHLESRRWAGFGWALRQRHRLLAAEMAFRGYQERSPLRLRSAPGCWPETDVDSPGEQFASLEGKYRGKNRGRIPLPRSTQELWAQHKYSVLARNQAAYRELGTWTSALRRREGFDQLAGELVARLRRPPAAGNLNNALQHMRGYLDAETARPFEALSQSAVLKAIQRAARRQDRSYLLAQTALTELAAWLPP